MMRWFSGEPAIRTIRTEILVAIATLTLVIAGCDAPVDSAEGPFQPLTTPVFATGESSISGGITTSLPAPLPMMLQSWSPQTCRKMHFTALQCGTACLPTVRSN